MLDADDPIDWIEAAAGDDGESTTPPKFQGIAYTGGLAKPRGFFYPVVFDLAGLRIPAKSRPVHRNHNTEKLVGHTDDVTNDGRRISCSGVCSAENEHRDEVVGSGRNGFPWRLSLGVEPDHDQLKFIDEDEKAEANGKTWIGPIHVLRAGTLHEISFVSLAGDDKTNANISAAADPAAHTPTEQDMQPFEQWIEAQGFNADDLTDAQRTALQATYDQLVEAAGDDDPPTPPAGDPPPAPIQTDGDDPVEQLRQQLRTEAATETRRQADIRRICAEHNGPSITVQNQETTIEAMALEDGWDAQRTELECLRESRTRAPAGHAHGRDSHCTVEAMQGALLLRSGMELDSEHWRTQQAVALEIPQFLRRGLNDDTRQRYMEAAHSYSDMSLLDVCREAIRIEGRQVPAGRAAVIEAAFSTQTLSNIFTSNVNARVLATYLEAPDTTMGWTQEDTNVPDYKLNERDRVHKGSGLKKTPTGGKATDDDRSDSKEEYRLARYARKYCVDDIDVINDRFNALNEIPTEMGLAAARLRPDLVYSILFANAVLGADSVALFDAAHNNDGAGALDEANLKAAITALAIQQEGGVNLNLAPTHIVTPQTLSFTADALIRSAETRVASATGGPTLNTLQGKVRTRVSDSRLDNGVTDPDSGTVHAGDTAAWYVVSADGHTIEVGYLRGSGKAPTIRRFTLSKGEFGIGWDVQISIGAKARDFKSMQRRTG